MGRGKQLTRGETSLPLTFCRTVSGGRGGMARGPASCASEWVSGWVGDCMPGGWHTPLSDGRQAGSRLELACTRCLTFLAQHLHGPRACVVQFAPQPAHPLILGRILGAVEPAAHAVAASIAPIGRLRVHPAHGVGAINGTAVPAPRPGRQAVGQAGVHGGRAV